DRANRCAARGVRTESGIGDRPRTSGARTGDDDGGVWRRWMIAIEIREPGGPEVLVPAERPMPVPAAGEVLIKVAAAGVNRPDIFQRLGRYPPPPGVTDIPGLEIAGTVEALGPGAARFKTGDAVCALVAGGGY